MRKLYLFTFAIIFFNLSFAQTGIHVQERIVSSNIFALNKDSLYVTLSFSNSFSRMALVNPATKDWQYINTTAGDYKQYTGEFVMKNSKQGVMSYAFNPNKIYRTNDGWKTMIIDTGAAGGAGITQLCLTSAGYVGLDKTFKDVWFSADGKTWTKTFDGSSAIKLQAQKNTVILYTGASTNAVSTDGGQTFNLVSSWGLNPGTFIDFIMFNPDTFALVGATNLDITYDGGANWVTRTYPITPKYFVAKNYQEFYILDVSNSARFTSDGGATWQTRPSPNLNSGALKYLAGDLYIWPNARSTDDGQTWKEFFPLTVMSSVPVYGVSFNGNGNFGVMGKANGMLSYSFDRGRSFSQPDTIPGFGSVSTWSLKVMKNGNVFAANGSAKIFCTTDTGKTWVQRSNVSSGGKFCVSANDSVIVFGNSTYPSISSNHGKTWKSITAGGGNHAQTIKPNGTALDVVGWFDYKTFQNKGWQISTWDSTGLKGIIDTFLTANESLTEIFMVSNSVGYLITSDNTTKQNYIYKTTNGWALNGQSKISTINPVTANVIPYQYGKTWVHTFGTDTIILVNEGNKYWHHSYNGGVTWTIDSLDIHSAYPTYYPSISRQHFFNAKEYIFTLNSSGAYLNVKSNGFFTGVFGPASMLRNTYNINVYPNPFSETTRFDLQNIEFNNHKVKFDLFDVCGNLVRQTAVSDINFTLERGELPAGIYFYRLRDEKSVLANGKLVVN